MAKLGPTASEEKYKRSLKDQKTLQIEIDSDLQHLLQQPQFRRWAARHIFGTCMVNKDIWDPSSKIHLFEGRRSVGIDLLKTFMKFPELYLEFERERILAEVDELERNKNRATAQENEDG